MLWKHVEENEKFRMWNSESLNWKCHLHSLEVVVGIWEQKEVGKGTQKPLKPERIFDDGVIGVEQWETTSQKEHRKIKLQ